MTTAPPATGPPPHPTEPTFPDDPAFEVWRQARTYVEDVFKTETRWAATQKRFTAFTALEYRDRFLIELIQNASDAHDPKGPPGLIWIGLDRDEERFGCLYVANTGRPFTLSNFRSLAELGMSDKEPGSGIGHKGVGFRSVLSVSDRPEIYSARPGAVAGDGFTGFCFGFASDHDIRVLTAEHPERFERVVSEVSPYCLPVPISKQPSQVQEFSGAGVATVVRLPIRDEAALESVASHLEALITANAPALLFLDRIEELRIDTNSGGSLKRVSQRRESRSLPAAQSPALHLGYVEVADQTFLIGTSFIPAAEIREQLTQSTRSHQLDDRWELWHEDAPVSVALRLDSVLDDGAFYTFLPMDKAAAPFPGHLNAPFVTDLGRRSLDESIPVNAFLLKAAATTAARVAVVLHRNQLHSDAVLDALSWDDKHTGLLATAFAIEASEDLSAFEFIPLVVSSGKRFGSLAVTNVWANTHQRFSAVRITKCTHAQLVEPHLATSRVLRLRALARTLVDRDLSPTWEQQAHWATALANDLKSGSIPEWDTYYEELAVIFGAAPEALAGKRILLDDERTLRPAGRKAASSTASRQAAVFFAPRSTDDDEDVDPAAKLDIPRSLRSRFVYMHPELTWREGRQKKKARQFLENGDLVREFRVRTLLDYVRDLLGRTKSPQSWSDLLLWTYRLFRARPQSDQGVSLGSLNLMVPTVGGWRAARDAYFSDSWPEDGGKWLTQLIAEVADVSAELSAYQERLLVPPTKFGFAVEDLNAWSEFLRVAGVGRTLRLVAKQPHAVSPTLGPQLTPEWLAERYQVPESVRVSWLAALTALPRPTWYDEYRVGAPPWSLPGQGDYASFSVRAKTLYAKLILVALMTSAAGWTIEVKRANPRAQYPDRIIWPTPASTFISTIEWMPMTIPGEREHIAFVSLGDAWHFDDESDDVKPNYAPLVPIEIRRIIASDEKLRQRLTDYGLKIWGLPEHSPSLVAHLGRLLHDSTMSPAQLYAFRKAYEKAWGEAVAQEHSPFAPGDEGWIAVAAGDRVAACSVSKLDAGPAYVANSDDELAEKLTEYLQLPVLKLATADLGERAAVVLEPVMGERLRRLSQAVFDVVCDGHRFDSSDSDELFIDSTRRWLYDFVVLGYELNPDPFERQTDKSRRRLQDALTRIRLRWVNELELRIDGVAAPQLVGPYVLPLRDSLRPTIVCSASLQPITASSLIVIVPAACELAWSPRLAGFLELALRRLDALDGEGSGWTDETLAAGFGVNVSRVAEARAALRGTSTETIRLLAPVICHLAGLEAARLLLDDDSIASADDLRRFLGTVNLTERADDLVAIAQSASGLQEVRDRLSIDYKSFNAALTALGGSYRPLFDPAGHFAALELFVAAHRGELLDRVRAAFYPEFLAGTKLGRYVELRMLSFITVGQTWLVEFESPPGEVIRARVNECLKDAGIEDLEQAVNRQLLTHANVVERNRTAVVGWAKEVRPIVLAWSNKSKVDPPELWKGVTFSENLVTAMDSDGVLDFDVLAVPELFKRAAQVGAWPDHMARTSDLAVLGLSQEEVRLQLDEDERARAEREARRKTLRIDGSSVNADDLDAVLTMIRGSVSEAFLATTTRLARIAAVLPSTSREGGGGPRGSGHRREDLTQAQKDAVGLAGEQLAFLWLQRHHEFVTEDSWKSRNGGIALRRGSGDDSLGYDFEVLTQQGKRYFEVKASTSSDKFEFEFGETEVAAAQKLGDRYRVLYIASALSSDTRRIFPLPNPLGRRGRELIRIAGTGIRFRFKPAN